MPALTVYLSLSKLLLSCKGYFQIADGILIVLATDDIENNFIPFLSGILLGNDQQNRMWFSAYIKNAQKVSPYWLSEVKVRLLPHQLLSFNQRKVDSQDSLTKMREALWTYLRSIMVQAKENNLTLNDNTVVQASSLLRLCCALKGIAGFK